MGTFYRNVIQFACQHVACCCAAADHGCSGTQCTCIGTLCTAQTEFQNSIALGCMYHTGSLCRDQALVVDDIQKCCFDQLCFDNGCFDPHQRFMREYNCAFGDRVYFTCKAEILQIANEALRENMQTFQICDVFFCKAQIIQIFDGLLQTCRNGIAVAAGVLSVEQVEYYLSVMCACFIVALHHSQLI